MAEYLPSKYIIKEFIRKYENKDLCVPCRDKLPCGCIECDIGIDNCYHDEIIKQ